MLKLFAAYDWIRRRCRSRGFGVQSPFAYWLIRYVIGERDPYYAYDDLRAVVTDIDAKKRKLFELYFRLANYSLASNWIDCGRNPEDCRQYVNAACKKTRFVNIASVQDLSDINTVGIARISIKGNYRELYDTVMTKVNAHSMLIIEDIMHDAETKKFWKEVLADERTGVTFDLYSCGIVFFDKRKYKQNYAANF
jgi:hypothetical protein